MEFNYQDVNQGYTSPDFLFNFSPGGDLAPKYKTPPAPNSIENLTAEYLLKQQKLNDAVQQQHKIDNLYERIMNEAPRRDVEVLPPENPADVFDPNRTRMRNVTPVDQQQEITELLEKRVKRPQTPTPAEPPITPNYKSIPLTNPLETPPTYTPRKPYTGPVPTPTGKPAGLPTPAGHFAGGAIAGGAEVAMRLVAGQPPAQAVAGGVGVAAGQIAGGIIGAGFGPVGMFVGGIVGGFIGGAIADFIYNQVAPPTTETSPYGPPPRPQTNPIWTYGGTLTYYSPNNYTFLSESAYTWEFIKKTHDIGYYGMTEAWEWKYWRTNVTYQQYLASDGSPFPEVDPRQVTFKPGGQKPVQNPNDPSTAPRLQPPPYNYYFDPTPSSTTPQGTPRGDGKHWVPPGHPAPKQAPAPTAPPGPFPNALPAPSPNPFGVPTAGPNGAPTPTPPPPAPRSWKIYGPSYTPQGSGSSPASIAPPGSAPSSILLLGPANQPPDGQKPTAPSSPAPKPTESTNSNSNSSSSSDICKTSCMRNLTDKVNNSEIIWIPLTVPVVSCELVDDIWTPKTTLQPVQCISTPTGTDTFTILTQFQELAKANTELCLAKNRKNQESEAVLTLPERYQIPVDGQIPQIIYVFREVRQNGTWGERMYPMTVPHPKSIIPPQQRPLPDYQKGSWEVILTLKDNTKVFINALSMAECERMIDLVKPLISNNFLENSFTKNGQRKGQSLLEITVRIFKVDYYEKGTKNTKPTWSKYFRN